MATIKIEWDTERFELSDDGKTIVRKQDGAGHFSYTVGCCAYGFDLPDGKAGEAVATILEGGRVLPFFRQARTRGGQGARRIDEPMIDAPKPQRCLRWTLLLSMVVGGLIGGTVTGLAHGGERWDRVKSWTADNWKPIVGCAVAPALIYKETRRLEKRAAKDAHQRAAAEYGKAHEAYETRFKHLGDEGNAPSHGGYWLGNDPKSPTPVIDQRVGEADILYYRYATNLWETQIDGSVTPVLRSPEARKYAENRTERPGQSGYLAYLDKMDKRDAHRAKAARIVAGDMTSRKRRQQSALAIATSLCAFTIKRR